MEGQATIASQHTKNILSRFVLSDLFAILPHTFFIASLNLKRAKGIVTFPKETHIVRKDREKIIQNTDCAGRAQIQNTADAAVKSPSIV